MIARDAGNRRPLAFVLDDETAVGTMMCKQLEMLGIEAWQFSDSTKFLAELRIARPKLVLLDLGGRGLQPWLDLPV